MKMFENAKPIDRYYDACKKAGMTWKQMSARLTLINTVWAEYGDWRRYQDDAGNLWEEYDSIGD